MLTDKQANEFGCGLAAVEQGSGIHRKDRRHTVLGRPSEAKVEPATDSGKSFNVQPRPSLQLLRSATWPVTQTSFGMSTEIGVVLHRPP